MNELSQNSLKPITMDDIAKAIQIVCENGGCPPDTNCAKNQDCHKCLVDWLSKRGQAEEIERK